MRMTRKHLQAKVDIVNGLLGYDVDTLEYNTVGSIQLYGAYGGTAVHRVCNDSHGVEDLSTLGTMRETAQFLSGMIAALRIVKFDKQGLDSIAAVMSGSEWSPDTLDEVADIIRATRREIDDI